MRRLMLGLVVLLVTAAPASAAPGFTPSFRLGGPAGAPVMAPDGTVVFPTYATVNAEFRVAAQVRPPGGPLADVQLLSAPGATLSGSSSLDVGGRRPLRNDLDRGRRREGCDAHAGLYVVHAHGHVDA